MSVTLAQKFSPKVSERLKKSTVIGGLTNRNYDWTGVDTVKVYSVNTFQMNDYDRFAEGNRYGNPEELGNTVQTWQVQQDSSFTGTIDKLNNAQAMNTMSPSSVLARQIREEVVPEIDTYVLQVIATAGAAADRDDIVTDAATTKDNAWTNLTAMKADIVDNEGHETGLKAVMTPAYYNMLLNSGFVLASDRGQGKNESGNLGTVDGMEVRICPSSRMPSNTDLIITHREVTTFADVLTDYEVHKKPQGVSGVLIEGRVAYDAFVDVNKVNEVALHKTA